MPSTSSGEDEGLLVDGEKSTPEILVGLAGEEVFVYLMRIGPAETVEAVQRAMRMLMRCSIVASLEFDCDELLLMRKSVYGIQL